MSLTKKIVSNDWGWIVHISCQNIKMWRQDYFLCAWSRLIQNIVEIFRFIFRPAFQLSQLICKVVTWTAKTSGFPPPSMTESYHLEDWPLSVWFLLLLAVIVKLFLQSVITNSPPMTDQIETGPSCQAWHHNCFTKQIRIIFVWKMKYFPKINQ